MVRIHIVLVTEGDLLIGWSLDLSSELMREVFGVAVLQCPESLSNEYRWGADVPAIAAHPSRCDPHPFHITYFSSLSAKVSTTAVLASHH